MPRTLTAVFVVCACFAALSARAAEDPAALIDKAIKAAGGTDQLAKVKAYSYTSKGTISFNGNENPVTTHVTVQALDHYRQEFDGEFGGNSVHGVVVMAGDKGTRSFGGNDNEMDAAAIANQKRVLYLALGPTALLALKGKEFKAESIPDETVGGKPAAGIKVTAPDGKDFKVYFDKETGLPAKTVAKVLGFNNMEFTQETTFSEYKEFGGVKVATKLSSTRDGEKFIDQQITEWKSLDTVDPKKFTDVG